mgnify:CR=1 FL=1
MVSPNQYQLPKKHVGFDTSEQMAGTNHALVNQPQFANILGCFVNAIGQFTAFLSPILCKLELNSFSQNTTMTPLS